jgi:hypothetical protein
MSGSTATSTPNLAKQLREMATETKNKEVNGMINTLIKIMTNKATDTAKLGAYGCSLYDERFANEDILSAVKEHFIQQGFTIMPNQSKNTIELKW